VTSGHVLAAGSLFAAVFVIIHLLVCVAGWQVVYVLPDNISSIYSLM